MHQPGIDAEHHIHRFEGHGLLGKVDVMVAHVMQARMVTLGYREAFAGEVHRVNRTEMGGQHLHGTPDATA